MRAHILGRVLEKESPKPTALSHPKCAGCFAQHLDDDQVRKTGGSISAIGLVVWTLTNVAEVGLDQMMTSLCEDCRKRVDKLRSEYVEWRR